MAKRVITTTEFIDDLDGGKAEGTISFSFGGQAYEIDLSKKNRAALEKALKPYIESGRRVRSTTNSSRGTGSRRVTPKRDIAAIREWARANGHAVSDRGRIPREIEEAYGAAN